MKLLLLMFGGLLAAGLFFVLADIMKLPKLATERALVSAGRTGQASAKQLETLILGWAVSLERYVHLDEYKRKHQEKMLAAAGLDMTPEVYMAYCALKSGLILLGIIPCLIVIPIMAPAVVLLAILTYTKEIHRADGLVAEHMAKIEGELPRFVSTIEQELRSSRDVLGIIENYQKHAGPDFARELHRLAANMRSSSYESALTHFESNMGSAVVSDITRGLIGVLRGDDSRMYFQMLSHDLKQIELQRLKARAAKIPPKIRVFSFTMLMCFMLTYIVVIVYQIADSMGGLF